MRGIRLALLSLLLITSPAIDGRSYGSFTISYVVYPRVDVRVTELFDDKALIESCYVAVKGVWICIPSEVKGQYEIIRLTNEGSNPVEVLVAPK